jgi:hypothetical protein
MAEQREERGGGSSKPVFASEKHVPTPDPDATAAAGPTLKDSPPWQEPRGVKKRIADADKVARTGSTVEPVRNTPPAGHWNDTSGD